MADELSGAVRRALADAVRGIVGGRTTVTRGTGTYVRTDADGTGWVLMAGADEPTPVNGRALIDAEPGDSVQWELDGTALSVTGNATTPAVGTRQVTREVKPVAERTEVAIEDAAQALEDAANAAGMATKYITDITNSGIWVTPEDAKPVNGAAAATTSGWHIADALELFRQGASVFRVWVESAATKVRIGIASLPHVVIDSDGLHLMAIGSTVAYEIMSITHDGGVVVQSESGGSGHRTRIEPGAIHALHGDGTGGEVDLGTASIQSSGADNVDLSSTAVHGLTTYSDAYDDLFVEIGSNADYVMTHDAKVLFEGSYASTRNAAITLPNPDKACLYFDRLLVEYEDAGGRRGSVWVKPSLGLTFGCQTVAANATTGVIVRSKTYEIGGRNGEVVDVANYTAGVPQYGRMNVSTSGAVTWQSANEIGIVRIIGFR